MPTVGFRFERRDARRLQDLADQWASEGQHPEHIGLFSRAASDAAIGEPMRVVCKDVQEAMVFADGFVLYGITRPAIEALQD